MSTLHPAPQSTTRRERNDLPPCGSCCNRSGTVPVAVFVTSGSGTRFTESDSYCPSCATEAVRDGLAEVAL